MKILITGASGLIGRKLGQELVRRGHEIVAISRSRARARMDLPYPCEIFEWNAHFEIPEQALSGVEAVIHLAGESVANRRWSAQQKAKLYDSRVLSARALIMAFARHSQKLNVFISASAIGFYGDRAELQLTETSERGEGFLADLCRDWEHECLESARKISQRQVALRTGMVLARQGGALQKLLPLFKANAAGVLGNGQQWISWIHLDDLVAAYVLAVENEGVQGPINAVAPQPVTNREFTEQLGHILQKKTLMRVPQTGLRLALGERARLVLESQRVVPKHLQDLHFQFHFPLLDAALVDLCEAARDGDDEIWLEQWLPAAPTRLFEFYADPANLELLAPGFLDFHVVRTSTPKLQRDTLLQYRLKYHGIPINWETHIDVWEPNHRFVDHQLKGPYQRWHHTHLFNTLGAGTLMTDHIRYRLPLNFVSRLTVLPFVQKDVEKIFRFRRQKMGELF